MANKFEELFSGPVVEFVASANEFCKYTERNSELDGVEMLKIFQRLLPFIYLKATLLPALDPFFGEENEKFVREEDWNRINDELKVKFGKADSYLEVFDERINDSDTPVVASLAENIADIYQDLKDFLILYQTGTNEIMNDAIWGCRLNFENYWGQKLLNALRAIHSLICSGEEIGTEPLEPGEEEVERFRENWILSRRQREYRRNGK